MLNEVSIHVFLYSRIHLLKPPSCRTYFLGYLVEFFARQHGPFLDLEADFSSAGKVVGEISNAKCPDYTVDIAEFRDCTGHDKVEGPVYGHHSHPDELAAFGCECWEICYVVLEIME